MTAPSFQSPVATNWSKVHETHHRASSYAAALCLRLKRTRSAARAWAKPQTPLDVLIANCETLITFLDLLEELRLLSHQEFALRILIRTSLARLCDQRVTYWRQRGKVCQCILGDENTAYHHQCVTIRLRHNKIKSLTFHGVSVFSHSGKEKILFDFFSRLVGTTEPNSLGFNLFSLFTSNSLDSFQADSLVHPFDCSELWLALLGMNNNASPGPDGFGPAFYHKFWDLVKPNLLSLATDFHAAHADLFRINKSYIVLIPKKPGACQANDYHPISIQNNPTTIISKSLTSRLQPLIPTLIHPDQTCFIKGRSISKNFIYAADIIQTCHKRKAPTIVLKLDFCKAFDSINWDALDAVLEAKGFPSLWRSWMQSLLSTSQSAILLSGRPGHWIQCRRGLRQGDPLSPYLFILLADTLQRLILQASAAGSIQHPISDDLPCLVIQYADDTLIILRGDTQQLQRLKDILVSFSSFSGLHINFDKSTFIPMHVSDEDAQIMASTLGCSISSFPQPYLGLPLSAS